MYSNIQLFILGFGFFFFPLICACSHDSPVPDDDNHSTQIQTTQTNNSSLPPPAYDITRVCTDTKDSIYETPLDLPPMENSLKGQIVGCYEDKTVSANDASQILSLLTVADTTTSHSATRYVISYRTYRAPGVPGIGTAQVYIPETLPHTPSPLIVIAHGTVGLADACAPSITEGIQTMILPFANNGYPVIAPDYAGMGNAGIQGYSDPKDTGFSVLDAARALRSLLPAYYLSEDIYIIGHSQGGGACYQALANEPTYGIGGTLKAIIPIAGKYQYDDEIPIYPYKYPSLIPVDGGTFTTVLMAYAFGYNQLGPGHELDLFASDKRTAIQDLITQKCVYGIQAALPSIANTYAELLDPTFLNSVVNCLEGSTCTDPGATYTNWMQAKYIPFTNTTVDVLVVQGMNDTRCTPTNQACVVQAVQSQGITPTLWLEESADHTTIVTQKIGLIRDWVQAHHQGNTLPNGHDGVSTLPACN
jgi:pimeloyl-ACP methyl ester carboxylesterase